MSRCFPFPPPGYKKNDTLDDTDLLAKEKGKEKKDKKDKKDKDRSESKERKHKDKKDRKEKHKEKKDKDKEKKRTLGAEDGVAQSGGAKGETSNSNSLQNGETSDSKFVLELGKRIRDDDHGARENGVVNNCIDRRRTDLPGSSSVENRIGNSAQGSDKKSKRDDARSINGRSAKFEQGVTGNACDKYSGEEGQKKMQGETSWSVNVDKQKDAKPNHVLKDTDGPKNRESEKKTKSMHKEITKEKEKEEMKGKEPNKEQPIHRGSREIVKNGQNTMPPVHLKEVNKSSTNGGILGKRKEHEVNGFLHDNGARPTKLPRPTSSSQLVGNGRKLEKCQTPVQGVLEKHLASNHTVEGKVSSNYNQNPQNGRKLGSTCGPSEALEKYSASNHKVEGKVSSNYNQNPQNGRKLGSNCGPAEPLEKYSASNHKVEGKVSSNYNQNLQNGRKLGSTCGPSERASEGLRADSHSVSVKEAKINGQSDMYKHNVSAGKPSFAGVQGKEKIEALPKVNGFLVGQQLKTQSGKPSSVPVEAKEKVVASKKLELQQSNKFFSKPPPASVQVTEKVVSPAEFTQSDSKVRGEDKVNGPEKVKLPNVCSSKPSSSQGKVTKPQKPHRDLKYLNQILSVPVVTEWSDFDDQEWLFASGNLPAQKAEAGTLRCDDSQNVWAEAFRIESADVFALPYVVPF